MTDKKWIFILILMLYVKKQGNIQNISFYGVAEKVAINKCIFHVKF